jgi:hypothetical protein
MKSKRISLLQISNEVAHIFSNPCCTLIILSIITLFCCCDETREDFHHNVVKCLVHYEPTLHHNVSMNVISCQLLLWFCNFFHKHHSHVLMKLFGFTFCDNIKYKIIEELFVPYHDIFCGSITG